MVKRVVVKDMPEYFTKCSLKFHFVNREGTTDRSEIFFTNMQMIFKLNFETEKVTPIYKIEGAVRMNK